MRKNKIFLVFTIITFFSISQIHAQISFPSSTPVSDILCKLFEGKWDSINNECIWKPNLAESIIFEATESGLLYTQFDTMLTCKMRDYEYTYIVTWTYINEKGRDQGCHFCGASMSIIKLSYYDDKISVSNFYKFVSKHGNWGFRPNNKTELVQIFDNIYSIKIVDGHSGQGYADEYITLYYDVNGINRLNFKSMENNIGVTNDESKRYEYKTNLTYNKSNKRIIFERIGSKIINLNSNEPEKIVPVNEKIIYEFKDDKLEKLCE